uniref:Uncharacterized protein n=1 Tax=viral metagenome TaxID=1070528 RepID=A0A6C0LJF7_9ZZZZ
MSEHIFQSINEHMLDSNNIARWCRYMENEEINEEKKKISKRNNIIQNKSESVKKEEYFIPKTRDKLFWCFYVALNGLGEFMKVRDKLFVHENETKYAAVDLLRNNKDKLKNAKIKIQDTECDLVGSKPISLAVLHALAISYSLSFVVVNDDIYYDFSYGDKCFIIDITKGQTKLLLGDQSEKIATIKETKYYIFPSKPIKAMSSYSAKEVKDIAKKLAIVVDDATGKIYNKTTLYGLIQSKLGKLI